MAWSKGGSAFLPRGNGSSMTRNVRRATSAMTQPAPVLPLVFCAYHMPPLAGASGKISSEIEESGGALSIA